MKIAVILIDVGSMRHLIKIDDNGWDTAPIGQMMAIPDDVWMPPGWADMDGRIFKDWDHPKLYNILGTDYNLAGDDIDSFRVPDYRPVYHELEPVASMDIECDGDLLCWAYRCGL